MSGDNYTNSELLNVDKSYSFENYLAIKMYLYLGDLGIEFFQILIV